METPLDMFAKIYTETKDRFAAIRAIRARFDLDLSQAKEIMIKFEGLANSLEEYEERFVAPLKQVLETDNNR